MFIQEYSTLLLKMRIFFQFGNIIKYKEEISCYIRDHLAREQKVEVRC